MLPGGHVPLLVTARNGKVYPDAFRLQWDEQDGPAERIRHEDLQLIWRAGPGSQYLLIASNEKNDIINTEKIYKIRPHRLSRFFCGFLVNFIHLADHCHKGAGPPRPLLGSISVAL